MSMNDKAYEYYESLSKFLNNEKFYNFDLVDYSGGYPMGISKISIEVEGDWKHDHWLFKDLVNDWVAENGINLFKIDYQEIGESDSDYYTAQYDIFIAPNEDTVSTLNNMSKLFRESLFDGKKSSNSRKFLKESKVNMVPKEFTYTLHIDNSSQDVTSYVVVIPNGLKASDGSTMDAVVYAEDENGNEINFSSIDEAQKWIDTYKDNLSFHVKNRDELHATPMGKEKYDESLIPYHRSVGMDSFIPIIKNGRVIDEFGRIHGTNVHIGSDGNYHATATAFAYLDDDGNSLFRPSEAFIDSNGDTIILDPPVDESLTEDTIKTKSGKWVNKGKEGTHGKFKTKKEADAQRKAMFANGYRESLDEDDEDDKNMVICDIDSLPLSKEDKDLLYRYLGDDASSRLYTNGNSFVFSNWYDSFEFDSLEELMDMVRYDIAEWDKLDKRGL